MASRFPSLIESTFRLKEYEGRDKVAKLPEAIRRLLRPKASLNVTRNASAAINEVLRQYWGTKPQFTLIMSRMTGSATNLIAGGLVGKLICTNCSYDYPTLGPIRIIQQAYKNKTLDIETWSLLTLQQRLQAGAMGIGFMPTKSIAGSSLAEENKASFHLIENPFIAEERIGVVKALTPDISLLHAPVADRSGNALLPSPFEDNFWGPRASRNVILTVDKIVPTSFIREHSYAVRLPGYLVDAVCEVPFGSHPEELSGHGIRDFESYSADYDFMEACRRAGQTPETLRRWISRWVLGCKNHEEYLHKLGQERLSLLKSNASANACERELASLSKSLLSTKEPSAKEKMIITTARKIKEIVLREHYTVLLMPAGISGIASRLAYYELQKQDPDIDLIAGSGMFGLSPRPVDPSLINIPNLTACKMLLDTVESYGVIISGQNNKCLSVLGAAQVDKHGNLNLTKTKEDYLVGCGGANDAVNSRETIVMMKQSPDRLVEKVPYVTCPGQRVKTLVTDMGVFEKRGESSEFVLTAVIPESGVKRRERTSKIRANCGYNLRVVKDLHEIPPPTPEELMILRCLDVRRHFL